MYIVLLKRHSGELDALEYKSKTEALKMFNSCASMKEYKAAKLCTATVDEYWYDDEAPRALQKVKVF